MALGESGPPPDCSAPVFRERRPRGDSPGALAGGGLPTLDAASDFSLARERFFLAGDRIMAAADCSWDVWDVYAVTDEMSEISCERVRSKQASAFGRVRWLEPTEQKGTRDHARRHARRPEMMTQWVSWCQRGLAKEDSARQTDGRVEGRRSRRLAGSLAKNDPKARRPNQQYIQAFWIWPLRAPWAP